MGTLVTLLFYIIIMIVIVTVKKSAKKGRSAERRQSSSSDHYRSASRTTAASYDQNSLDYCDSHLKSSRGITFRGLPAGTDELRYLRHFNAARERELEAALKK